MMRTRVGGSAAGGGRSGAASRKSQIIEEEDEVLADESFEEYEEVEEVDDFSPMDEKNPGLEGIAPGDGIAIRGVAEETDPAMASAQRQGKAVEGQLREVPLGLMDVSEEEYPPFSPSPRSEQTPEPAHPPRSSSLIESKPGSPRSNVTVEPRTSKV